MQRIGIIDLGSNSVRLVVLHIHHNGSYNLIYTQKASLRLSQRFDAEDNLKEDAVADTVYAVEKLVHMCGLFKATQIIGVATAAMRKAKNAQVVLDKIKQATNITLRVIRGEEEAYLGYLAAVNSIDEKDAILFDLGGGSMEVILIRNRKAEHLISLNIGATSMTEKFKTSDTMSSKSFRELTMFVRRKLNKSLPWLKDSNLPIIGIGGTVRNLAKIYQRRVQYLYPNLHNYRMKMEEFDEVFNILRNTNDVQRKKISGLNSDRTDIILAGATIINTLFSVTKSKEFIISGCGLREGLFYEIYFRFLGKDNVLDDVLEFSINNLLNFALGSDNHSQKVLRISRKLFTGWKKLHKLSDIDWKILHVAASLHDVGISINYYDHPKHSAYLIENAPLMGLTHREQIMAALVANWHNGISAKYLRNRLYKEFLREKDMLVAKKLALILAMAENLDFTETDAVQDVLPEVTEDGEAILTVVAKAFCDHDIEISELKNNLNWFKKEFKTNLSIKKVKAI